jgi:hypothetical protein
MVNKTAVQWLFEEYKKREIATDEIVELFVKAEQMEKEQIIRTHLMARCYDSPNSYNEAEEYYNETFKSE